MKRFIRDSIILFYDIIGKIGRYRQRVASEQPLLRVVAFHDITDPEWFRSVIDLLDTRYHLITPDDLLEGNLASEGINVLLTFDDGYESWLSHVVPVLDEHEAKGLFFVTSGLLEVADDEEARVRFVREELRLQEPHQTLSWDGAQILLEYGHSLGGHTVNHKDLASLKKSDREDEVFDDKQQIELQCKLKLDYFAFPFGAIEHVSRAALGTVRAAGYTYAMTAIPGFARVDKYVVPRVLLEEGQSLGSVRRWVEGGYDLFFALKTKQR